MKTQSSFHDFLSSLGLIPNEQIIPEKWTRCATVSNPKKKNGAYLLAAGETHGYGIDFGSMSEQAVWRANGQTEKPDPLDNAALTARLARKREEEREAIGRARAYWKGAQRLVGARNGYLVKKRLTMLGCAGLRVIDDTLLVPMYCGRNIVSVQSISADGAKKFFPGCPAKGCVFRIERPRSTVTILAEGLATSLCLFSAIPTASVVVAFSAGNLVTVAEREEWSGLCAVASDNDWSTEERIGTNPGREAAEKAAAIIGCGCAIPPLFDGTDWHDLWLEILEKKEAKEEFAKWKTHPAKLMNAAGAQIRASIMGAAKLVSSTTREK